MKKETTQNYEMRNCDMCESYNVELEAVDKNEWDEDSGHYVPTGSELVLYCQDCGEIMIPELEVKEVENV